MASVHVDDLGIYLWSNKTLYSHVSLHPLPSDFTPVTVDLPTTAVFEREEEEEEEEGEASKSKKLFCFLFCEI